jgi:hypothetical protein
VSERYGTKDELYYEIMPDFEEWVCDEIEKSKAELRRTDAAGDPRYESGRLIALRDVLSWWRIDH